MSFLLAHSSRFSRSLCLAVLQSSISTVLPSFGVTLKLAEAAPQPVIQITDRDCIVLASVFILSVHWLLVILWIMKHYPQNLFVQLVFQPFCSPPIQSLSFQLGYKDTMGDCFKSFVTTQCERNLLLKSIAIYNQWDSHRKRQ